MLPAFTGVCKTSWHTFCTVLALRALSDGRAFDFQRVSAFLPLQDILGDAAAQAIRRLACRAAHPEYPVALSFIAALASCTNGAKVDVFPSAPCPVMLCVLNVNYPQTRKSAITAAAQKVADVIDELTMKRAAEKMKDSADEGREVRITSSTLTSFTEAAFFQRCAGDWQQIEDATCEDDFITELW